MNTLANDLFDKLNREEPEKRKQFKQPSRQLKRLDDLFNEYLAQVSGDTTSSFAPIFLHGVAVHYTPAMPASIIRAFSDYVSRAYKYPELMAPYLNLLCYASCDKQCTFVLHQPLSYVGYQNPGKHLRVIGDVGNEAGAWMAGGSLTIIGNAGDELGLCLQNGRILVSGNVAHEVGRRMSGGSIYVRGNAGECAGQELKGGRLHIRGDVGKHPGFAMEQGTLLIDGSVQPPDHFIMDTPYNKGKVRYRGKWYGVKQ